MFRREKLYPCDACGGRIRSGSRFHMQQHQKLSARCHDLTLAHGRYLKKRAKKGEIPKYVLVKQEGVLTWMTKQSARHGNYAEQVLVEQEVQVRERKELRVWKSKADLKEEEEERREHAEAEERRERVAARKARRLSAQARRKEQRERDLRRAELEDRGDMGQAQPCVLQERSVNQTHRTLRRLNKEMADQCLPSGRTLSADSEYW